MKSYITMYSPYMSIILVCMGMGTRTHTTGLGGQLMNFSYRIPCYIIWSPCSSSSPAVSMAGHTGCAIFSECCV